MKLHVVYDESGKIVAAVRLDEDGSKQRHAGHKIAARPIPKPGHTSAELDVPGEHAHLKFAEACGRLMVETSGAKPHLKPRPR